MDRSPCCYSAMIRVPSLPSAESYACTNYGMVYERETWACEDNDETETYRIHLRKVKSSRSWAKNIQSEKPVPSQRLRCSPGADYA